MPGRPFHQQIEEVRAKVLELGRMARLNVVEGVRAFVDQDVPLARQVVEREEKLNRLDVEIERDTLDLLALNQPLAADLRTLGATLKIITYLDRIGRYGYDIAKATLEMEGRDHTMRPAAFTLMAEKGMAMLDEALAAYKDRDAERARSVAARDNVVDDLYDQAFRQAVTYMMEDPRTITAGAHNILVARHLERAADNAVKIAEKALYLCTGERRITV